MYTKEEWKTVPSISGWLSVRSWGRLPKSLSKERILRGAST